MSLVLAVHARIATAWRSAFGPAPAVPDGAGLGFTSLGIGPVGS